MAAPPSELAPLEAAVVLSATPKLQVAGRWAKIGRNLEIWIPGTILALMVILCFLGPYIFQVPSPINGSIIDANLPAFSPGHLFGTDPVGNDIFSRLMYGGRVSIEVGVAVNLIGIVIGGFVGVLAAYKGGPLEFGIMRVLDVIIAFPSLVLALAIAEALGPGELHVIYALSFFSVPAFARLARSQALRLRNLDFVLAARLGGTKSIGVVFGHIFPNVAPNLLTFSCLGISVTILIEAALSFLGLGVRPPDPSWGDMISQGQQYLATDFNLVLVPSLFLLVTAAALNLLGDGLRAKWSSL